MPNVNSDRRPASAPFALAELGASLDLITPQPSKVLRVVARRGHRAMRRSYLLLAMQPNVARWTIVGTTEAPSRDPCEHPTPKL
jgi:hypothetical protein